MLKFIVEDELMDYLVGIGGSRVRITSDLNTLVAGFSNYSYKGRGLNKIEQVRFNMFESSVNYSEKTVNIGCYFEFNRAVDESYIDEGYNSFIKAITRTFYKTMADGMYLKRDKKANVSKMLRKSAIELSKKLNDETSTESEVLDAVSLTKSLQSAVRVFDSLHESFSVRKVEASEYFHDKGALDVVEVENALKEVEESLSLSEDDGFSSIISKSINGAIKAASIRSKHMSDEDQLYEGTILGDVDFKDTEECSKIKGILSESFKNSTSTNHVYGSTLDIAVESAKNIKKEAIESGDISKFIESFLQDSGGMLDEFNDSRDVDDEINDEAGLSGSGGDEDVEDDFRSLKEALGNPLPESFADKYSSNPSEFREVSGVSVVGNQSLESNFESQSSLNEMNKYIRKIRNSSALKVVDKLKSGNVSGKFTNRMDYSDKVFFKTKNIESKSPEFIILLDSSGSMSDDMAGVNELFYHLVINLNKNKINCSLSHFDTQYYKTYSSKKDKGNESLILSKTALGGTRLYPSLLEVYKDSLKSLKSGNNPYVLVLTDGDTGGEDNEIVDKINEMKKLGVNTEFFLMGNDYLSELGVEYTLFSSSDPKLLEKDLIKFIKKTF